MFRFKFLPPGRGLWAMGTKLTEERFLYASLNNCAFVSTNCDSVKTFIQTFTFLMDMCMLGVGVGFDTKGAGKFCVKQPLNDENEVAIEDSRNGWVNSVKQLIESYFLENKLTVKFNYSKIRPEGIALKGFGGLSSGPGPLILLHKEVRATLDSKIGDKASSRTIVDLMNQIGKCVINGNIRSSAEIAFGDANDADFLALKNYDINSDRAKFGWASNNSIFAEIGMDYSKVCELVKANGEPGFAWLANMRKYGRMADPPNNADWRASGGNPCLEQTLESFEMCCLVETFPFNHDNYEEFQETLRIALLYAKTVTLGMSHWPETNEIIVRNRRIGCSISGITQFI